MSLLRRRWLQMLLSGIVLLFLVERGPCEIATSKPTYAPSIMLLGALLVPITLVTYLYERLPSWEVSLPAALAVCLLWAASYADRRYAGVRRGEIARFPAEAGEIGLIEESAKLIVALGLYFLGR